MEKRWRIQPHDAHRVAQLERSVGAPPVVAQLLAARGLTDPEEAREFLDAKLTGLRDPELLPGAADAAERLHAAIQAKRRIVIYGDYDADGMTATGILHGCLKLLGADVGYYVPNRMDEGYGLNHEALKKLAERGASLVISVDCGVASVAEALTAKEVGLELIVTDHHQFADSLPEAACIVHPRLPGTAYPFAGLCGAGVALKVAWAVCQRASQSKKVTQAMRDYLMRAVGLAAVGTVADVVPLLDENRVLVRHGLRSLRDKPPPGVAALLELTQLNEKPELNSEDIGFRFAPRLNAAGRLGQAQLGVELLVTESKERAEALADYIHQLNKSRESLERSIYLAAQKQAQEQFDPENDPALVLAGVGWHPGVIGIVSGRLAEKYGRPVILISWDQMDAKPGVGSARSASGLNLHEALKHCQDYLVGYGGHAQAAGLKIEEERIDGFRAELCEYVASEISAEQRIPEIRIDAEALFSQLTLKTMQQIEQLAPFGQDNPRPVLFAGDVQLSDAPRKMGGGDRHLLLTLEQYGAKMRAVGFGMGEEAEPLSQAMGQMLEIAYRPVINEFRGRRSVEMHLVDWRKKKT